MIDDNSREFIRRHIGPSEEDIEKMLKVVGANSLDDLINKTVPENILLKDRLKIGDPTSEHESMKQVKFSLLFHIWLSVIRSTWLIPTTTLDVLIHGLFLPDITKIAKVGWVFSKGKLSILSY